MTKSELEGVLGVEAKPKYIGFRDTIDTSLESSRWELSGMMSIVSWVQELRVADFTQKPCWAPLLGVWVYGHLLL